MLDLDHFGDSIPPDLVHPVPNFKDNHLVWISGGSPRLFVLPVKENTQILDIPRPLKFLQAVSGTQAVLKNGRNCNRSDFRAEVRH